MGQHNSLVDGSSLYICVLNHWRTLSMDGVPIDTELAMDGVAKLASNSDDMHALRD